MKNAHVKALLERLKNEAPDLHGIFSHPEELDRLQSTILLTVEQPTHSIVSPEPKLLINWADYYKVKYGIEIKVTSTKDLKDLIANELKGVNSSSRGCLSNPI
jgi:hypothetical protein